MDARDELEQFLLKSNGYYNWEATDSSKEWYFRTPREDLMDKYDWLRDEQPFVIHICRPEALMESIKTNNKEESIRHSAHAGQYATGEIACLRCEAYVPENAVGVASNNKLSLREFQG
jgi:hypothetical protein